MIHIFQWREKKFVSQLTILTWKKQKEEWQQDTIVVKNNVARKAPIHAILGAFWGTSVGLQTTKSNLKCPILAESIQKTQYSFGNVKRST